jgi:hypothetical protein
MRCSSRWIGYRSGSASRTSRSCSICVWIAPCTSLRLAILVQPRVLRRGDRLPEQEVLPLETRQGLEEGVELLDQVGLERQTLGAGIAHVEA